MRHILYSPNKQNKYKIGVLIKDAAFYSDKLHETYFKPLSQMGLASDSIIGLSLKYDESNKAPIKIITAHLDIILQACNSLGIKTLLVADAAYFKKLAGQRTAEPHHGYILPCTIKGYSHISIVLSVNYQQLFYNPTLQYKLDLSIETVAQHLQGTHTEIGIDIIHSAEYYSDLTDIEAALADLHKYSELTVDIEAFSLNFWEAGIATIAFAWNQHNGIAMQIDYTIKCSSSNMEEQHGLQFNNVEAKALLKIFFETYKGNLTYHGGTYDIKVIIYELFMDSLLDSKGLINGLDVMYQNVDDTKIITYLATNTTSGNHLGLKPNSFEWAGNYAQDEIKDVRKITLQDLLKYNLTDCLATWYVKNKNLPIMLADDQKRVYDEIMIPSMKVITHMELTGMPMDIKYITILDNLLGDVITYNQKELRKYQVIKDYMWDRQRDAAICANLLLKNKVRPLSDFKENFNPSSDKQVQELLYDHCGLDIIDRTKKKAPATGAKTLKKLLVQLVMQYNITDKELNNG